MTGNIAGSPYSQRAPKLHAVFLASLCVVCWSIIPIIATREHSIDDYQLLALSNVVSASVLILILRINKKLATLKAIPIITMMELMILGTMGAYWYYILLFKAYDLSVSKLDILAIQYTWPIFTILFARLISKERLSTRTVAASTLASISVIVAVQGSGANWPSVTGVALALSAAAVFGLFSALNKTRAEDPLTVTAIYFIASAILGMTIAWRRGLSHISIYELSLVLVNGIFVNGISYVWWLRALSLERATTVAPIVLATPIIAATLLGTQLKALPIWTTHSVLAILGVFVAGLLAVSQSD